MRCNMLKSAFMLIVVVCAGSVFVSSQTGTPSAGTQPPIAVKILKLTPIHGDTLSDNFFWLREKSNPKVLEYLKAEDAYAQTLMNPTAALQEKMYQEMLGHLKQTDMSAPYPRDGFYYYTRTQEGKQYPIYCRRKGNLQAPEEVILDQNELAQGLKFMSVGVFNPSDDGKAWCGRFRTTAGNCRDRRCPSCRSRRSGR